MAVEFDEIDGPVQFEFGPSGYTRWEDIEPFIDELRPAEDADDEGEN